ncbi:MAG TPA: DUF1801 domain-containing protein [Longimicrobium sp.]|jgi:hypothetical protein|nr:DUF1801 domain-containing protein [Longimicrobium sp.]
MASSKATTAEEYLQELPEDRRAVVSAVRDVVLRNLPKGYRETMGFGMITWGIPLQDYPDTYNGQPLGYAALAAQKNYYALYLMSPYMDAEQQQRLRDEFEKAGKKLDMGKSCLRFKKLEDLPLDVVGRVIASTPPKEYIARYEAVRAQTAARA